MHNGKPYGEGSHPNMVIFIEENIDSSSDQHAVENNANQVQKAGFAAKQICQRSAAKVQEEERGLERQNSRQLLRMIVLFVPAPEKKLAAGQGKSGWPGPWP